MTIETKFEPGENVWIMIHNKTKMCVVYEVIPGKRTKTYNFKDTYTVEGYNRNSPTFYEEEMFKTKEELINSL